MSEKVTIAELQTAADQCVKCAVCLPHCPTYALSAEEAESPRGRITLLQGIVYGRLQSTTASDTHLNNCLSCGRCEQVCPARVPYTRLLDGTRALAQGSPKPARPSLARRLAAWLLTSRTALRVLAQSAQLARTLGFDGLVDKLGPQRLSRWLDWSRPPSPKRTTSGSTLKTPVTSQAWLFAGCLSDAFEADVATSASTLALAYGVQLNAAPKGLCCGALYQHSGNLQRAQELTAQNIDAFSSNADPVVVLATGCSRGMTDGLGFSEHPSAKDTQSRITDLFTLLDASSNDVPYTPVVERLGIYAPCSAGKMATSSLFRTVSHALKNEPVLLGAGHGCCGAAGDHMLTQPAKSDQLASPIVDEIEAKKLTRVLAPNIGCAWHLRANLKKRGSKVTVEHPASWLARRLRKASP